MLHCVALISACTGMDEIAQRLGIDVAHEHE
jgi:hypothetical protein